MERKVSRLISQFFATIVIHKMSFKHLAMIIVEGMPYCSHRSGLLSKLSVVKELPPQE